MMSNTKELAENQYMKIESRMIRLAIIHRLSAKIAKSIEQDKALLVMLMQKSKSQLLYANSQFPVVLNKLNGVYKVYSDITELSNKNEKYFNDVDKFIESKLITDDFGPCLKENELDAIFHEACSTFPEFTSTEILDIYSNKIEKHDAYPID